MSIMTLPPSVIKCPCVDTHGATLNTTVTISQSVSWLAPLQLPAFTIVTYSPFAALSPLVPSLGCGHLGAMHATPLASFPAFEHPASQISRNRDLIKEWADERMVADLKFWSDVFEKDEPKLSKEFMQLHEEWKSLSASERAIVQEKLEDSKKKWLVTLKRA